MGNVHSVTGLAPCLSVEGALLPVRRGSEEDFVERLRAGRLPSYVTSAHQVPSVVIGNPNVFSNRVPDERRGAWYLVIQGGGKWGYREEFREYVEGMAPLLDDAHFLLSDEYQGYVDSYQLRDGQLVVTRLVDEGSEAAEHARVLLGDRPDALFELDRQEAEQWLRSSDADEALLWVDRALERRPDDAALLCDRGYCLGQLGRHQEALEVLDRALAALPDHSVRTWGTDDALLEVVDDVAAQLTPQLKRIHVRIGFNLSRLGRYEQALEHFVRSHAFTPTWGAVDGLDNACATLLRLGRLDEAEARIDEMLGKAGDRRSIARAYLHRAGLRARRGQPEAAVRDVETVIELQPYWRAELADDEDLSSLRSRADFMALCETP